MPFRIGAVCMVGVGVLSLSITPDPLVAQDACDLVTEAEASALVGSPVTLHPVTPGPDPDTGATLGGCIYEGSQLVLALQVLTFSTPAAAAATATDEALAQQLADVSATVVAEPGLGDRSYWVSAPELAAYFGLAGARLVGASVSGDGFRAPEAHRAALRGVVAGAIARLD